VAEKGAVADRAREENRRILSSESLMARKAVKTETIVIDKGANRILAERSKLHKSFAIIGVQGSEAGKSHKDEDGKSGINLVELATIHEFGAPNVSRTNDRKRIINSNGYSN